MTTTTAQERAATVIAALVDAIRAEIVTHQVTYDEYTAAKAYLADVGAAGEWPLFGDVFFEAAVEQVACSGSESSDSTILGPFYLPDSAVLSAPYVMPMREAEGGDRLTFSGTVSSSDGTPIAGAVIEMWQCDHVGSYADIPYPDAREIPPPGNLRGQFATDGNGMFEVLTILPVPYEIPKAGPTGKLLAAAGWHAFRPAHLHCIVNAEGHSKLITQLYLGGDPYIESDVASAVKPGLIVPLDKAEDGQGFATEHHFRLAKS